jgi:hypothetical protein
MACEYAFGCVFSRIFKYHLREGLICKENIYFPLTAKAKPEVSLLSSFAGMISVSKYLFNNGTVLRTYKLHASLLVSEPEAEFLSY